MSDVSKELYAIKCLKMMEIFEDKDDGFYSVKELKKLTKNKGIGTSEVENILQSLVSDGKLESDKIGSMLYYWSFPEEEKEMSDKLKLKNKELNDKIETLSALVKEQKEIKVIY